MTTLRRFLPRPGAATLAYVMKRLRSPQFARSALWISVLVLIAGVVAFATVRLSTEDDTAAPALSPSEQKIDGTDFDPGPTTPTPKQGDVPSAARVAAGEFVLAAAGREDLPKAWKLAHPELRQACGCTYKQWLTGNIPVQYYPTAGLQGATFNPNEVAPGRVVLEVLLTPKQGSNIAAQAFYIGLKQQNGTSGPWLVDYWAPISATPVPQSG